uniref:Uncharacterized protein n=1 Tax=Anguilla anguilla TaxID=7936 RepID=A0A0E9RFY4_ANGAN
MRNAAIMRQIFQLHWAIKHYYKSKIRHIIHR